MSKLIINSHIIDSDIELILNTIKIESQGKYCTTINTKGNNIGISCPFHKDGQEVHPSCYVYNDEDGELPVGYYRCFTCGSSGPLYKLVAHCLDMSFADAKQWLVTNFSSTLLETTIHLPEIDLSKTLNTSYIDESILEQYAYFHPYQFERNLTEEVILKFKVGYNVKSDSITFPVWDEHNNLVGITERSVNSKRFYIPSEMKKPVYLLNFIENENITDVVVCESQINALTCWSWGIPAIALIGTGSKSQYEVLKKSGIRNFHLAFDGDYAGKSASLNFIKNMPNHILIDVIEIPDGKDVNDLTKDEFLSLRKIDRSNFTVKLKEFDKNLFTI